MAAARFGPQAAIPDTDNHENRASVYVLVIINFYIPILCFTPSFKIYL